MPLLLQLLNVQPTTEVHGLLPNVVAYTSVPNPEWGIVGMGLTLLTYGKGHMSIVVKDKDGIVRGRMSNKLQMPVGDPNFTGTYQLGITAQNLGGDDPTLEWIGDSGLAINSRLQCQVNPSRWTSGTVEVTVSGKLTATCQMYFPNDLGGVSEFIVSAGNGMATSIISFRASTDLTEPG